MLLSSCSERNPIGRRTETDRTADGNRSDGGRKPIGRRTETDRTADGNDRGCSCLSCTNQANRTIYSGCLRSALPPARARTAPTKPTEQSIPAVSAWLCRLPEQELHQPSNKANNTNVGGYGIPAVVTQSSIQISFH